MKNTLQDYQAANTKLQHEKLFDEEVNKINGALVKGEDPDLMPLDLIQTQQLYKIRESLIEAVQAVRSKSSAVITLAPARVLYEDGEQSRSVKAFLSVLGKFKLNYGDFKISTARDVYDMSRVIREANILLASLERAVDLIEWPQHSFHVGRNTELILTMSKKVKIFLDSYYDSLIKT